MKKHIALTLLLITLSIVSTFAQYPHSVAVSQHGILLGKSKITPDTRNSIPDTISLEEVKSIFAINSFYIDKHSGPQRLIITGFQMTVRDSGGSKSVTGNSEFLNEEQITLLNTVKSGQLVYFEGILGRSTDGSSFSTIPLSFFIR